MEPSLVAAFDEIVAASDVLNAGEERVFSDFITSQMGIYKEVENLHLSLKKQHEKVEAKDIELKLSRNSLQNQMNKCTLQEDKLKEYEKQFMILKFLISSDDKLNNLNEAERRSLAILRQRNSMSSPGLNCTDDDWGTPEVSVNVTDATDLDEDETGVGYRAHWKRRRTASSEYTLDSSISKKKRSIDSSLILKEQQRKRSLDLDVELNMTPPLEKQFKRPPPGKNRRKPSKGHLVKRSVQIETPPSIVPPLDLPQEEDSPLPSAPLEVEVAMVNSGLLSPRSNDGTPPPNGNPDLFAAFPHSPLSPLSMQPLPLSPSVPSMGGSPRLYPCLELEGLDYADTLDYAVLTTPPGGDQVTLTRTNSDINMTRKHNFQSKTALKLENCEVCKKKVNGFGKNFLKCQDCRAVSCVDCQDRVPLPCIPTVRTPKKKQKDSDLATYCPNTIPRVPSLIVHCVKELEDRGLNQVGLYRVPGSDRNIKELKERLLKSRGTTNLNEVEDVNVLCGCIKQFLIALKEPLVTNKLNPLFLSAVDESTEEKVLACLLEAIAQLPPCNKDTLAFVILHLQKIVERANKNKMPIDSIASVFGPTLIGSTSSVPAIAMKDVKKQKAVMERLLGISPAYWRQYLSSEDSSDNGSPRHGEHPHGFLPNSMFNSPSTPELMPIPQSPFLGPCQSPRNHRLYGTSYAHTPVVTRSTSASANITSSVSRSAKKNGYFAAIH